jgi:hypothetical protein
MRSAKKRFAPTRFALLRFAFVRLALRRSVRLIFAPTSSASPRSSIISGCCFLHSFQAATPFFRIARCSSFAIVCHPPHRVNYRATLAESWRERKSYQPSVVTLQSRFAGRQVAGRSVIDGCDFTNAPTLIGVILSAATAQVS